MTIEEYFKKQQPVSTAVDKNNEYKNIRELVFGDKETNFYASISIAHVGEDLWSFGYSIRNGSVEKTIYQPCSPVTTYKGNIRNLLCGVTKYMARLLGRTRWKHIVSIKEILNGAMSEAAKYKVKDNKDYGKICI